MASKKPSPSSDEIDYFCTKTTDQPLVALSDGTMFPESVDLQVVVRAHEELTLVNVALEVQDGRPTVARVGVRRLDVGGVHEEKALTPTFLHDLNFRKIFDAAIEQAAFMGVGFENPLRDRPAAIAAANSSAVLARRRQPLSDDLLMQVVAIVNQNQYDPRKQVASTLYVSERTASRWIAEAKRRGLFDEEPTPK